MKKVIQTHHQLAYLALFSDEAYKPSNILKSHSLKLYNKSGDSKLLQFPLTNRLKATLTHSLLNSFQKTQLPTTWHETHQKKLGIARGIYHCVGCCPIGDLDVLVRFSDFRQAQTILTENGFTIDTRCVLEEENIEDAIKTGGTEYTKVLPCNETLWFELQWQPVGGHWIQEDQEPTADELMERSIPIPSTDVRLLSPEDNLLRVTLYLALCPTSIH